MPSLGWSTGGGFSGGGSFATTIVVGGTAISGGTSGKVLYDNAGVLGEANLFVESASILALRNSTTSTVFLAYNTYTDASNYERAMVSWSKNANRLSIGVEAAGTGTMRPIDWYASTHTFYFNGSTAAWDILITGHFVPRSDATYNVGSATNRLANIYSTVFTGGSFQAATSGYFQWANGTTLKTSADGIINLFDNAGTSFGRLTFGGTTSSYPALKRSSATLQARLADDSAYASFAALDLTFNGNAIPGAPLSTSMTSGFINLPGATGVPSGVPSNTTGFPAYWDSTNLQFYAYSGGAWKKAAQIANGPAFSAYAGSATSLASSTYTKVLFDTEDFDTNNNFSSSRFTPTVAGYYQVNAGVQSSGAASGGFFYVQLYKNGSEIKYSGVSNTAGPYGQTVSSLVYMNGSTDYLEVYAYQTVVTAQNTTTGANATYFNGSLVRGA